MSTRMAALVGLALIAMSLAPATLAADELLAGERLIISNSMGGSEDITGTTEGSFSCGSSSSQLQMSITGNAYGPYPGTFSQTIDAQVVDGVVQTFDVTFEILSAGTTITGSAQYVGTEAGADCYESADEDGVYFRFGAGSGGSGYEALPLEYSATIDDGVTQVADVGPVQAGVNLYCYGSPVFTSNCAVATTILRFEEPAPPPPPPSDPPVITDVSFSTTTIENGTDPVTMTVTATITDDLEVLEGGCVEVPPEDGGGTECSGSEITFVAPSGSAYAIGWLTRDTGDVYQAVVTFPAYAAVGTWTAQIAAVDSDYQYTVLASEDMVALGFPGSIEVTGTADIAAPELLSLSSLNTTTVDMGDPDPAQHIIVLTAEASDDLSGIYSIGIVFASAAGDSYSTGFERLADGTYRAEVWFDQDYLLGDWSIQQITLEDVVGNQSYIDGSQYPRSFEVIKTTSGTVAPGGTFSSSGGNSDSMQLAAEITVPAGGDVTIVAQPNDEAPAGYTLFGYQFDITAPDATAAEPLTFRFIIGQYLIPPDTAIGAITVLRNGVAVANCSGAAGTASPDPCVASRSTTGDGDVAITVLTSQASVWNFGVSDSVPTAMSVKQDAISALEATAATGKAAKAIQLALGYLRASLTANWWLDADHLDPKLGTNVFDQDLAAVKLLTSKDVAGVPGVTAVLDLVAQSDRMLAATALDDATNAGGKRKDLQAAANALAKGDAAVGAGAYYSAIANYKNAWLKAQAALR